MASPRQRTKLEVPQMTNVRFHERFRWPTDQVLLISMGVVATPQPVDKAILGRPAAVLESPPRADLLVMIESKAPGMAARVPASARSSRRRPTGTGIDGVQLGDGVPPVLG